MQASEIELHLCVENSCGRAINAASVEALAESISQCGLLQPITVRRASATFEVIAGMHRVTACRQLGWSTIPANILDVDDLHAELMLIDENLCRNDLTPAERASAQARRKAIYQQLHPETARGGNQTGPVGQFGQTEAKRYDEAAAHATGHSERTVRRDVTRGEALGEEALAKVARTSLDKGEELDALAKCSSEKQRELIERAAAGEKVSAKVVAKQERRSQRESDLGKRQLALPQRKFGVIVADPEWRFEPWSRESGMDRAADNHYPTSVTEVIAQRDVASIADKDCVLFLWATAPMLPHALMVMGAWGFDYRSNYVWAKDRVGTGYWNRNAHEHLLVGVKGDLPAPAAGTQRPSLIEGRVAGHSAKPNCFLEMIEEYFPTLPKIELNRRGPSRPGWAAWGNEADAESPSSSGEPSSEAAPHGEASHAGIGSETLAGREGRIEGRGASAPATIADLDIPEFLRRGADGKAEYQRGDP